MNTKEKKIFEEACLGYGFDEVGQTIDGTYCTGCNMVHKRPTKMYSNKHRHRGDTLCRYQVVRLYNPEEQ